MLKPEVPVQSHVEICDLSFIEQVFIWSLRMKIRGDKYFAKVTAHCENNLSPAAARIALTSINMIVTCVKNHGIKSLCLNCTCMTKLSSDEWLLIKLFRAANSEEIEAALSFAVSIVEEEGGNLMLHALLSFQMAMETIDRPVVKKTDHTLMAEQMEQGIAIQTSKMIH